MKIKDKVLFRYESKIDNGTLFIFDLENYKRYQGGKIEYLVLLYIEQGLSADEIINNLNSSFEIPNIEAQLNALIHKFVSNNLITMEE